MAQRPAGFHTITPQLTVHDAAGAIAHYTAALGADLKMRLDDPAGGRIMHSCIAIGDSNVFVSDEYPERGQLAPKNGGGAQAFYVYVDNVDATHPRALKAGMTEVMAPADTFWGDRISNLVDPFGHRWTLATHVRDIPPDEMMKAMAAMG